MFNFYLYAIYPSILPLKQCSNHLKQLLSYKIDILNHFSIYTVGKVYLNIDLKEVHNLNNNTISTQYESEIVSIKMTLEQKFQQETIVKTILHGTSFVG